MAYNVDLVVRHLGSVGKIVECGFNVSLFANAVVEFSCAFAYSEVDEHDDVPFLTCCLGQSFVDFEEVESLAVHSMQNQNRRAGTSSGKCSSA